MLAHDLEGNPAGVEATMDELMKVIEGHEPLDSVHHPETLELYERLSPLSAASADGLATDPTLEDAP